MKPWLVIIIVLFIAVAGYQFGYYHGKLTRSNAEKHRLNSVLERTRTQTSSELKVTRPPLVEEAMPSNTDENASDAITQRNIALRSEYQLAAFFTDHPNGKRFSLSKLKCSTEQCHFAGEYTGDKADFSRFLDDLKAQSWWQEGVSESIKHVDYGITRVGITFSMLPSKSHNITT